MQVTLLDGPLVDSRCPRGGSNSKTTSRTAVNPLPENCSAITAASATTTQYSPTATASRQRLYRRHRGADRAVHRSAVHDLQDRYRYQTWRALTNSNPISPSSPSAGTLPKTTTSAKLPPNIRFSVISGLFAKKSHSRGTTALSNAIESLAARDSKRPR